MRTYSGKVTHSTTTTTSTVRTFFLPFFFSMDKQQEVLIQSPIEKVTRVHRRGVTSLRLEPPLQEEPRRIARLKVIRRDHF